MWCGVQRWLLLGVVASLVWRVRQVEAVDHGKFKTCAGSAHCRRYRKFVSHVSEASAADGGQMHLFEVVWPPERIPGTTSIVVNGSLPLKIRNVADDSVLAGELTFYDFGAVRFSLGEEGDGNHSNTTQQPGLPRFRQIPNGNAFDDAIVGSIETARCREARATVTPNGVRVEFSGQVSRLRGEERQTVQVAVDVQGVPFMVSLYVNQQLTQRLNSRQLLNFEKFRAKADTAGSKLNEENDDREGDELAEELDEEMEDQPSDEMKIEDGSGSDQDSSRESQQKQESAEATAEGKPERVVVVDATSLDNNDSWNESQDSKPQGPAAVGADVTFFNAAHVYGLPEHAAPLSLPAYDEPYRFYNLDVFEYILDTPMALYGSVPLLWGLHRFGSETDGHTNSSEAIVSFSALLWTNPSETFVKLDKKEGSEQQNADTWWTSETGIIDLFFFIGPEPQHVLSQYYSVSGLPFMPPLFALGRHQSRWNYNDQTDVKSVSNGFDKHDIPCDVIWLDIEHTDGRKYFTWRQEKFSDPLEMIANLRERRRKLVLIVDPHIKSEKGYRIYDELASNHLLVKRADGSQYKGWCWPGDSVYPDFLHPKVRDFWRLQFAPDKWIGTTDDVYLWNDMNEPSVFNGPEVSMPRDVVHLDGYEHRAVHNLYGKAVHSATFEGLLHRNPNKRPFVLSRAFFIGSHRTAAVWTGDNTAEWSHLAASLPMVLSHALGGIQFIGADIGGFFNNPSDELLIRWEQFGIWYPFYRSHAHIDTKRREPWQLENENDIQRVRAAVVLRYRLLPFWYTLFAENALLGKSIIQPLWWIAPKDAATYSREDSMVVGETILVKIPQTADGVEYSAATGSDEVYLPRTQEPLSIWYAYPTPTGQLEGGQVHLVEVKDDGVPAFARGGSLIFTKDRVRRASAAQNGDPLSVSAFLDAEGFASGRIYVDDYDTYAFRSGHFAYERWEYVNSTLTAIVTPIPRDTDGEPFTGRFPGEQLKFNTEVDKVVLWGLENPPVTVSVDLGEGPRNVVFAVNSLAGRSLRDTLLYSVVVKQPGLRIGQAVNHRWKLQLLFS